MTVQRRSTANGREMVLFHETLGGGRLHFYPRGVAAFGSFDAAARLTHEGVRGATPSSPLRLGLSVPFLLQADWKRGTAPRAGGECGPERLRACDPAAPAAHN